MDFHLQHHSQMVEHSQTRKFKVQAQTHQAYQIWQTEFSQALQEVLGIRDRIPDSVPQMQKIETHDHDKYLEEKYIFQFDNVFVPLYVLMPKVAPPYYPVVAFHGHGMGVQQIIGNYPTPEIRDSMVANDENFAQRLAQAGFLVVAIEQRGFGERITDQSDGGNSCRHLSFQYLMTGKTLLGERVREAIAVVNYLCNRDDIITNQLTCVGHSGGATTALFLSALDDRLTHTVLSGYFCDFSQSILAMPHCECNYIPHLLTLGNIADVASLLAPRHLLLIQGKNDPIFPISGFHEPYKALQNTYHLFDARENIAKSIHDNGHQFNSTQTIKWLNSLIKFEE